MAQQQPATPSTSSSSSRGRQRSRSRGRQQQQQQQVVCREILEDLELELGPDGDEDEEQELDLNALKEEVFLKLLVTGKFELFAENGFIKISFSAGAW